MAAVVAPTGHDYGGTAGGGVPGMADVKGRLGRSDSQDFGQLVLACNKEGMDYLRKGQYKQAFEQLKYAEAVLVAKEGEDEPTNLLAVTCNNLGCYYKKVGKLHAALSYLRKALKIEVSLQTDDVTVAGTHLNICAILSKLDKHDKAVQHAMCALDLISNRVSAATDTVSQDEYSVLAIAYHNVAVERDYLHQWDQAAAAYKQGFQVAKKCLGEQHALTQTLGKNCDAAVQKSQKFSSQAREHSHRPGAASASQGSPARARAGRQPPDSHAGFPSGSQANSGLLPELPGAGARVKDAHAMQDEPLPIPSGRSVHQDADDWIQHEAVGSAPWRTAVGSAGSSTGPPAAPGMPAPPPLSQQYVMSPRVAMQQGSSFSSASASGPPTAFAPYEHGAALPSDPIPGAGMESMDHWPQQATFLDSAATDVRSIKSAADSSPPPLVLMNQDKPRVQRSVDVTSPRGGSGFVLDDYSHIPAPPPGPRPPGRPPRPGARAIVADQEATANAAGRQLRSSDGGRVTTDTGTYAPAKTTRAEREAARAAARQKGASQDDPKPSSFREPQAQALRKVAAETLQRVWRAHWKLKQRGKARKEREMIAATMIQARWRAFHVRRAKHNKYSTVIQRHVRGYLVRLAMKRQRAAIAIQRHTQGLLARNERKKQEQAALMIQRIVRGNAARRFAQAHQQQVDEAAAVLQRGARMWQAKKVANEKRQEKLQREQRHRAAMSIQSVVRGRKDREKVASVKKDKAHEEFLQRCAVKLQSMARKVQAISKVDALRKLRLSRMHDAATTIRKFWLRYIYRKRFLQLRNEFLTHEPSIVTIQRYVRGYLVRLRMWRDAIRAEEELWAAVEIQRCWRGYLGRLRWELAFEAVWSRDAAAHRIQRYVRGWLARTRVQRLRKRLARAEFQKARRRFKAAQRIQALVRGYQVRKRIMSFRSRKKEAATKIQKVFRGHKLRCALWEQVIAKRIIQIQALARGFIVRNRKFKLVAKVILIQRSYRHWLHFMPEAERQRRLKTRRRRQPALE